MDLKYEFVPEFELKEEFNKKTILSYAAKLLQLVGQPTIVLTIDSKGVPVILSCCDPLRDHLDFTLDTY